MSIAGVRHSEYGHSKYSHSEHSHSEHSHSDYTLTLTFIRYEFGRGYLSEAEVNQDYKGLHLLLEETLTLVLALTLTR